jgi:hypothetical protein
LESPQQAPAVNAGPSFEDLVAALVEAASVFVARLREPHPQASAAPVTPREPSAPNRDYF